MDRNTLLRVVLIAGAILLFWKFGMPLITGSKVAAPQAVDWTFVSSPDFVGDVIDPAGPNGPNKPNDGEICKIIGKRFDATMSARGAGMTHLYLRDERYRAVDGFDMSTTPDVERWRNLRTTFRGNDAKDQVKYDRFPWKLEAFPDERGCKFTYEDEAVRIVKTVAANDRPFELQVDTQITNLTDAPKRHEFSIATYAYRQNKDMKGSLGRQSPLQTSLECSANGDVQRKAKGDFKSGWFTVAGADRFAAVNNQYFSQALIPMPGEGLVGEVPTCAILAEDWYGPGQAADADDAGNVFHAKLSYAPRDLAGHQSVTYRDVGFFGPKERDVLAKAAGGRAKLGDVVNLGFFTPVARGLIAIMVFIHDHITNNWGLSIIALTIALRTLLFPLTYKSIKTTIAMRRLKPDVDALNAKFKDDAQAKNLAMMELWKKNGVNPFGGCLPQVVQMPVWFAMYTTLQTAVEMYHVKFLWFADLSSPDKFFILPILLGGFMILQQRIVPQQGMDPMQAKMMMWLLPGVFTVMMLFLPAALGVYMLTNSILGIVQQLAVERIAPRTAATAIVVKQVPDQNKIGKGKARV